MSEHVVQNCFVLIQNYTHTSISEFITVIMIYPVNFIQCVLLHIIVVDFGFSCIQVI